MSLSIHLVSVRKALAARREPYWGSPLRAGGYLGVRKLADGTCTWIARLRDDTGKQKYRAIGQVTDKLEYAAAKTEAETWFDAVAHGVEETGETTVRDACAAYVAELTADGREEAARDAELRFERTIYEHELGRARLDKLRTEKLKTWRNELGGAKASQNRNWTALRAALNLAVERKRVNAAVAVQWRAVKQHKGVNRRREIYLDLKQRRALIAKCAGGFRDLVEAAALTGARPGELAAAKRAHFDARTRTITFSSRKSGSRTIPLSPPAVALFKRVAEGKLPEAPLITRDDGEAWQRWDWDGLVRAAAKAAKLPAGVVLYTLRHSWITEALVSGMATLEVARLTGTSLEMIEEHYGHLVASSARERLAQVSFL